MEPLEEAVLKEFCGRLAKAASFAGVDVARLWEALSGEGKPKAEEVIAVLQEVDEAAPRFPE